MLEGGFDGADTRDRMGLALLLLEAGGQLVRGQGGHDDLGAPGGALGAEGALEAVGVPDAAADGDGVALHGFILLCEWQSIEVVGHRAW